MTGTSDGGPARGAEQARSSACSAPRPRPGPDGTPSIPGLAALWSRTLGEARIRVAVVDGAVDTGHPAFAGASLTCVAGVWPRGDLGDARAVHGTMVASVLFGQHDGPVQGIAPGCTGISVPVFCGPAGVSQVELARALECAVAAGAHVINVSGGRLSPSGEAGNLLGQAVQRCRESNVLVVAAAGNDGCDCVHVPAGLPSVLAVGALDGTGRPMACSNWGEAYRHTGIMAPGEDVLGAVPGGRTARLSGTSLAAPIVAGVAALLLSTQVRAGRVPDPRGVGEALLATADRPPPTARAGRSRYLAGILNAEGATRRVADEAIRMPTTPSVPAPRNEDRGAPRCRCAEREAAETAPAASGSARLSVSPSPVSTGRPVEAAPWTPLVYAIGVLGYDFATEARRDSFRQLMAAPAGDGPAVHGNPYDARSMVDHLTAHPSETAAIIWTLSLDLTPIYAIEPVGAYAADVNELLVRLLAAQSCGQEEDARIERIALPGRLSGRTVRLFTGQVVPVVEVEHRRGLCGWEVNRLADAAVQSVGPGRGGADTALVRRALRELLTRVYYDLRNLGATSRDRALNFAATNAFQATQSLSTALADGLALDSVQVDKSPFGRQDSDCWDIKLRFFDPENSRRAKRVYRFTIDVSDVLPVTLGEVRTWPES